MGRLIVTIVGIVIGGTLAYWVNDRTPPTVLWETKVHTPIVTLGDSLVVTYHGYRTRDCYTHIDRFIIDSAGTQVVLPDIDFYRSPDPLGEFTLTRYINITDAALKPGRATYRTLVVYQCNLFHKWFWPISPDANNISFDIADK